MKDKETDKKPMMHLINKEFLDELAQVRMYGNEKYEGEESWRLAPDIEYLDAAMRHLLEVIEAYKRRDVSRLYDKGGSGRLHAAHVASNMMFVITRWKEFGEEESFSKYLDTEWLTRVEV